MYLYFVIHQPAMRSTSGNRYPWISGCQVNVAALLSNI